MSRTVKITECEMEVLVLLSRGLTPKQIAEKTHRTLSTVNNHTSVVRKKLRCSSTLKVLLKLNILIINPDLDKRYP